MCHLVIVVALLVFTGLDVVFVQVLDTLAAALTFVVLAYLILLILSGEAGSFPEEPGNDHGLPALGDDVGQPVHLFEVGYLGQENHLIGSDV